MTINGHEVFSSVSIGIALYPDVEHITAPLEKTGVAPGNLELEITEGAVMHSEEAAIKHMQRLKTLGIHLTMDDFGIGYSSLSFLTRFPIDHLKIDRSFVSDLPQNQEKRPWCAPLSPRRVA